MDVLNAQYELVRGSRAVMLNFIENVVGEDYTMPVTAFDNRNIHYFLLHIANTYKYWTGNFAMNKKLSYAEYNALHSMTAIRGLFDETDLIMAEFLQRSEQLDGPVTNVVNTGGLLTTTPLELFTHTITHEFHHKGQIMAMCRLLGHIPPDTDIIRY